MIMMKNSNGQLGISALSLLGGFFLGLISILFLCNVPAIKGDTTRHIYPGINLDPWNQNHGKPPPSDLILLHVTWVRIEFKDFSTSPNVSTFGFYDPIISEYKNAGIKVLLLLDYASCAGSPGGKASLSQWKIYIEKYLNKCKQIVSHYGDQIGAYEIWNEEDLPPQTGYDPYVPVEAYALLLKSVYEIIKNGSKSSVIFGGLASGDPSYVTNVIHANSGKIHADGLGVHPYGRRPYDDWPSSSWGFGPLIPFLQDYYAVAKLPIWITEVGTNDMKVQDQFPNKTFSSINEQFAIQSPYVFWFCWSDGMVSPFGVVNVNGKKKPSYDSYKQFASLPWKTN